MAEIERQEYREQVVHGQHRALVDDDGRLLAVAIAALEQGSLTGPVVPPRCATGTAPRSSPRAGAAFVTRTRAFPVGARKSTHPGPVSSTAAARRAPSSCPCPAPTDQHGQAPGRDRFERGSPSPLGSAVTFFASSFWAGHARAPPSLSQRGDGFRCAFRAGVIARPHVRRAPCSCRHAAVTSRSASTSTFSRAISPSRAVPFRPASRGQPQLAA